ncbi:diguanylate cyclase with PAS/PAC sensor [Arcobacter nitrofigilis DSM 7299]|uniref:Diguanylate cyclase with PAS/PAC sensor n=1 Tax=Arcobacter nitrofigilis (strain ATCC 33309 / DSM 7299 / CCUG 15893 / LMG 7604 / NCTC 12251 / CI) TaxID=572480 RepID=D5V0P5_ARCNC|nr:transporter substrate-binding domain-containing protein [Arcobacter nitrofigilis]ADG93857.1 diguanylate cyclase with PAS/PAC sensor [Arcobacter nitrofigilis DSM 7299]
MAKITLKFILIAFLFTFLYSDEKVTLQLKWFHQFQFAGYYAAKEKGFYKDVGLDVEIKQRDLKYNNIEEVVKGKAQYGVSDSILILYKAHAEPVVIVSPIFQHSASALISLKNSGINSPYDLEGKNVLFYPNDTDGFAILAMLQKLKIKPNFIREREKDDYLKLLDKKVDASPVYLSNEPFYFKKNNIDINIINPSNYGFDFYGDILFTSENEAKNHPQRVKKFKEATLKGWNYALEHQEEIIQLIHNKYNSSKSVEHLRYEAKAIEKLISREIIPLGSIDKGRIRYISDLYKEFGSNVKSFNVNDFIFKDYIIDKAKINLTQEEKEYLENHPVLKVQNLSAFPPYNFYENNKPQGYTVDYMNLLAKILGVKIEFVGQKSWKEYLDMIKDGKLDIIPHIAINKERSEFLDFTDIEHITYQPSLAIRKGSGINSFGDLKDKTIAVLNKSFLHTILKNKYPNQKLYLASSTKKGAEAVSTGLADAFIGNLATTEYYIKQHWLSNLEIIQFKNVKYIPNETLLYMGVSKGNNLLKSILEKANREMSHNKVIDLKDKWLNIKPSSKVNFTDEEYKYLLNKKKLKMCIDPNWLPFEKIEKGKYEGIASEYIKLFEKELPIPIELVKSKNWLDTISLAQNRACDFITMMKNRKKYSTGFNITKNLVNMNLVIATKVDKPFVNDISSLEFEKLAVVKGYGYAEILKNEYPDINIVEVKDAKEGLAKVDNNEVYGFIDVLPLVAYNIQENFVANLKIAGKLDKIIGFPMATRNDEPQLNEIMNKLISNISEEKNKEILNKWLSIKYEENINFKPLFYVILIFSIILFIIIIKNRAINKLNNKLSEYLNMVDENVLTSSTDKKGIIVSVSQAFCDISGYTKEELLGNNHRIIRHEDMPKELFSELWSTISSGKKWTGEIKNKKKNGGYYWVDATISPIFDKKKNIIGYTAIRHDISDKKTIESISITDELTKLYNRRHFNEIFEKELSRVKRTNHFFALIILDVDFFKQYNDFYGHQKGDYVLESIGKRLKEVCKRSTDIPFRIGGEEFAIIFIPKDKEDALNFAKLINEKIEDLKIEHKHNKASDYITASLGLYVAYADEIEISEHIYNHTDSALYKAKESGRNRFVLYEKE